MKTRRTIWITCLILMLGICGILFAGYKVFLDKPGFFRQFDNEDEVREFLNNNLALNEDSKDYAIEYIHQHLSRGEGCTPLWDTTFDICLRGECLSVTDETQNTAMACFVLSSDIFVEYEIRLYFEYDTLIDIEVEPVHGLP